MMDIMLDLETMGTGSNAAIIAVGAVKFNRYQGIVDRFHKIVDLESSLNAGMEVDAGTILWWMKQSDSARKHFEAEGEALVSVLMSFSAWIGADDPKMWGNGASFDNAILGNAYRKFRLEQPWEFWNDRCYRTIKALVPNIKMNRVGTYHCAVDDAESQALHLIQILNARELGR